jgi:hypothetical protein
MGGDVWSSSTSDSGAGVRWWRLGGVTLGFVLCLMAVALLLAVQAPQATAADTASISGTVTNSALVPLGNIQVRAYRYDGTASWTHVKNTLTADPGGTYTLDALAAGTYRLKFVDEAGTYAAEYYSDKSTLATATDIVVAEAAVVTHKDASLVAAGHITGTVTNAAAAPLQSVTVIAYQNDGDGSGWVDAAYDYTGVTGTYDLTGLATGTYRIMFRTASGAYISQWYGGKPTVETATDVAVTAGATTSGINATLAVAGHITGAARNAAGTGLDGVSLYLSQHVNSYGWTYVSYAATNADGTYDLGGLATGSYRLEFGATSAYVGEYYDDALSWNDAANIAVTAGATTSGINATLAAAGHITGTVKDAGGVALRGTTVTAFRAIDDDWDQWRSVRVSAADGSYDLSNLPAGTYRLRFSDQDGVYATQFYNDKLSLDLATDVVVTAGATTSGINATLAAAGHIAGSVKSAAGAAVPGVWVEVYRDDGAGWMYVDETLVSNTGTYDMGGLPAGTYRVSFWDSHGVYAYQFYTNAWVVTLATDVVVTGGATTGGIDQTLAAAGHITGTIKDSAGAGLKSGLVEAYRFDGADWRYVDDERTDASGAYDLGYLLAGAYRLRFSDRAASFLPQWYGNTASVESSKDIIVTAGATTSGKNAKLVAALPRLGTPACPKSVRHGAKFKVTGALKPHYASGAKTVTVKAYRKAGSKWKLYKSFKAVDTDYRSYSKYSATVTLSRTGQYRFKASTRATAEIPASTTGFSKTTKVK